MKRSTWMLAELGAFVMTCGLVLTLGPIVFQIDMMEWPALSAFVIGLVILAVAQRRATRERARDKEITGRAAHHVLALRREKEQREQNKTVKVMRREKRIADEKRKPSMEARQKRTRWKVYECRNCDWKGSRFIRKKGGLRICPACKQPVRERKA